MIQVFTEGKDILLKFYNPQRFTDIVLALKKNHCWFNSDTKSWILSKIHYEEILSDLEELDRIEIKDQEALNNLLTPEWNIKKTRVHFTLNDLSTPPIVGKHPYENYQLEDLQKTLNRNKYALYLDVGTGKSWIILNALNILRKQGKLSKILYITSNSGVYDIYDKFLTFTSIPKERITIGNKFNRRPFDIDCDVIICNYRSFLLISDEYQKDKDKGKKVTKNYRSTPIPIDKWTQLNDSCCVLDESHNIATPTSRQTKAIQLIAPYFEYRYLLSGTPADTEEKYYSQLHFLDPTLTRNYSYTDWCEYYANVGTRFSQYAIASFKVDKLKELQYIIKENCSRRLGEDVLNLPPNIVKKIYLPLVGEQKEIYEGFLTAKLKSLQNANGSIKSRDIIKAFQNLILTIDNPEILKTEDITDMKLKAKINNFKFSNHLKVEVVKDIILDHSDSKIIIWTSHPSVGNNLAKILEKYNPLVVNGEINPPKGMTKEQYKNSIVKEFQTSKDRKILIAGIQVLNTAQTIVEANVQIYFDTDFNYTNTEQSYARIYRIGQKKKVFTYKILIKETLDITRDKMMEDKDFINDHFLSHEYINQAMLKNLLLGDV
jgi:SNF2 family DNA or RNA helicase